MFLLLHEFSDGKKKENMITTRIYVYMVLRLGYAWCRDERNTAVQKQALQHCSHLVYATTKCCYRNIKSQQNSWKSKMCLQTYFQMLTCWLVKLNLAFVAWEILSPNLLWNLPGTLSTVLTLERKAVIEWLVREMSPPDCFSLPTSTLSKKK